MLKREKVKGSDEIKITFIVPSDSAQGRVSVVGDFNGWDPAATVMTKRSNGTRSATVVLAPANRYEFRYITEDGTWFNDAAADAYSPSGLGSQNCIVLT